MEHSYVILQIGCLFLWELFLCVRQIKSLACPRTRKEDSVLRTTGNFVSLLKHSFIHFKCLFLCLYLFYLLCFEKQRTVELKHSFNTIHCLVFWRLYWFSAFFYSVVFKTMAKVPLNLMIENEVLLEEQLLRLLDLHVSLKRTPDSFWKGHENLKINFFSQKR